MKKPSSKHVSPASQKRGARLDYTPHNLNAQGAPRESMVVTSRSLPFSHNRWFVANPRIQDSALND